MARPASRRRTLLTAVAAAGAVVAAVGAAAATAADDPAAAAARARGLAVQVRLPELPSVEGGYVESESGTARTGGPYAVPGNPQLATVGNTETVVDARPGDATASASASARLAAVSLLGGLVTAEGVAARAVADAHDATAEAAIATQVTGLVVAGQPVPDGANELITLPGVGDLLVGEQVDALRDPLAARSYAIGLHLRLRQDYAGLPAGTEIIVGYVDAGAAVPPPAAAVTTTTTTPASATTDAAGVPVAPPSTTATTAGDPFDQNDPASTDPAAALANPGDPIAGSDQTATAAQDADGAAATAPPATAAADPTPDPAADPPSGGSAAGDGYERPSAQVSQERNTSDTQDPPPGGFTRTPPISRADHAQLLSGSYDFPVFGGATFSDDFGSPRAGVAAGFHQGIDLFGSRGTPIVAIHDGTVFRVGWNTLGGNRLWLDDGEGNLYYFAHLMGYVAALRPLIGTDRTIAVRRGQVLGYLGDTGQARGTPPHLHFEIHPNGRWAVPPIGYVTAWRDGTTGTAAQPLPTVTDEPGPQATGGAADAPAEQKAPASSDIGAVPGLDRRGTLGAAGA